MRYSLYALGKIVEAARTLRSALKSAHWFDQIPHPRFTINRMVFTIVAWRIDYIDYNVGRPYKSLGHLTPNEFAPRYAPLIIVLPNGAT